MSRFSPDRFQLGLFRLENLFRRLDVGVFQPVVQPAREARHQHEGSAVGEAVSERIECLPTGYVDGHGQLLSRGGDGPAGPLLIDKTSGSR